MIFFSTPYTYIVGIINQLPNNHTMFQKLTSELKGGDI